jgi:hypothetical protein
VNCELPIHLCKANAQPQSQVTRLLQEGGHHGLEAVQQLSTNGMQETTSRIQGLRQALADWQEAVSEALGSSTDMPSFAQLCQPWTQPPAALAAAPRGKTGK